MTLGPESFDRPPAQDRPVALGRLDAGYYHVDIVSEGALRAELLFEVVEEVDHPRGAPRRASTAT